MSTLSGLSIFNLQALIPRDDGEVNCGPGGGVNTFLGLRIASVFVILVCSCFGAFAPVLATGSSAFRLPQSVFDFAKYFGSGVIISTAIIHLLDPAVSELSSPCLPEAWHQYPYALALCMVAVFGIFIAELLAFRWGTKMLAKIGETHDVHGHGHGAYVAHGPERNDGAGIQKIGTDVESINHDPSSLPADEDVMDKALSQIIGVAVLESGIALHSVLIGLALAVDPDFKIVFVVLIFHQTFEGLGVGSRLAQLKLKAKYNWVRYAGALIYGITTPVGIAAGLGVRSSYNPGTAKASIVSGVLDSLSAGILIYTGLVELLAHEFLFNKEMIEASNRQLAYPLVTMLAGAGIMALLARWI